jgi:hypothetical protein
VGLAPFSPMLGFTLLTVMTPRPPEKTVTLCTGKDNKRRVQSSAW